MLYIYCLFVIVSAITNNSFSFRFQTIVINRLKQLAKSNTRYTVQTLNIFRYNDGLWISRAN